MLRIAGTLGPKYSPRTYVLAESDKFSKGKLEESHRVETKDIKWHIRYIPRSREVRQGLFGTVLGTSKALIASIVLVAQERPDLVGYMFLYKQGID